MSVFNFNGRAYESFGSTNSDFLIKTKGKIKIQWGNKFIDLIKDGKINTDSDLLNIVKDSNSIGKLDGIYYAKDDGSLWVVVGGNKINLKGEIGTVYVSYMVPQDTTLDQKKQAQQNIGILYKNLQEAQQAGIVTGFVFIEDQGKIFVGNGTELVEYQVKFPNPLTEQLVITKNDSSKGAILINGRGESNGINLNNDASIYYDNFTLIFDTPGSSINLNNVALFQENLIEFMKQVKFDQEAIGNMFQSDGATKDSGFRLYYQDKQSTLEVDNLIVRNGLNIKDQLYPVKYFQEENIINQATCEDIEEKGLAMDITLLLDNEYKGDVDDYLCTFITVNGTGTDQLQGVIEVNCKVKSISEENKREIIVTEMTVITENEDLKNELQNFQDLQPYLTNKHIYYMAGKRPVTRIEGHNIDLLNVKNVEEESDNANVKFRIGSVKELEVDVKGKKITDYLTDEEKILGIYSDNALFEDPQIVQPEIYISENQDTLNPLNTNTKIGDISKISMLNGSIINYTTKNKGIYSDNAIIEESAFIKTKQYNTEFKNLDGTYPKYEEGWIIPEESDDQTIATTLWVQTHIKPMKEDIKKNRTDIDANAAEIDSLWSALGALEGDVGDITINVEGNNQDISDLEAKVAKLEELIKNMADPNGSADNPVILVSGYIYTNADGTAWNFSGNKKTDIGTISITRDGGLVKLVFSSQTGKSVQITSVNANQYSSPETESLMSNANMKSEGRGAHWLETRWSNATAYIREFHQRDGSNHSWGTGDWTEYALRKISITVVGYLS